MNAIFATIAVVFSVSWIGGSMFSEVAAGQERPQVVLAKDWTRFPPADRAQCLSLAVSGLYTDVLVCLEAKRDARRPEHE